MDSTTRESNQRRQKAGGDGGRLRNTDYVTTTMDKLTKMDDVEEECIDDDSSETKTEAEREKAEYIDRIQGVHNHVIKN